MSTGNVNFRWCCGGASSRYDTTIVTSFIWKNRIAWLIVIVVVGVAADQASKLWALDALTRPATVDEVKLDDECRLQPRQRGAQIGRKHRACKHRMDARMRQRAVGARGDVAGGEDVAVRG